MRVLIATVVHTPLDARIHRRQIAALLADGIQVTYLAPWSATGTERPPRTTSLTALEVPRAVGRQRGQALRAARRLIRRTGPDHDLILLHDPELLLTVIGRTKALPPVVLDVHEDTAASLLDRPWIPPVLRRPAGTAIRCTERWAERNVHLILAEHSYQHRFARRHPVVPNVPPRPGHEPPPPGARRVVYLGRIATSRGARELLELARRLHQELEFELIGPVDQDLSELVADAVDRRHIRWTGFLPNEAALERIEGALAGLSLIHPQPNHDGSLQTKILEYASRRLPVITTDLSVSGPFVRDQGIGLVVPPYDVDTTASALLRLRDDEAMRNAMADRGYALIRDELNWDLEGPRFTAFVRAWADQRDAVRSRRGSPARSAPGGKLTLARRFPRRH